MFICDERAVNWHVYLNTSLCRCAWNPPADVDDEHLLNAMEWDWTQQFHSQRVMKCQSRIPNHLWDIQLRSHQCTWQCSSSLAISTTTHWIRDLLLPTLYRICPSQRPLSRTAFYSPRPSPIRSMMMWHRNANKPIPNLLSPRIPMTCLMMLRRCTSECQWNWTSATWPEPCWWTRTNSEWTRKW